MARGLLGFVGLLLGAGCASSSERAGELELVVEPGAAPYTIQGRFHLVGLEPGTLDRQLAFDGVRSRASTWVPAGRYRLELHAGASVVCAGAADAELASLGGAAPISANLVSAPPRELGIQPGERLTARVALGPSSRAGSSEAGFSPCEPPVERVLSRR